MSFDAEARPLLLVHLWALFRASERNTTEPAFPVAIFFGCAGSGSPSSTAYDDVFPGSVRYERYANSDRNSVTGVRFWISP